MTPKARWLEIGPDFQVPIEVATEVLAMLGRRGQGKSYLAQLLAERFAVFGVQFVVLDPVGNWWGLRLAANGSDPGIIVPVLGGLRGDIPLEPTAGKIVADLIVDRGISAVLDVSQFETDTEKARFAHDFAARFYFRKKSAPSAVHVFLEEAQEFVPQNPTRDEARMLHAFQRMVKLGRNFGIGVSMLSQRPQEVNKKTLNLAELLFAFQMTGPQERKTVQGWIAEKGLDEDIYGELPKLKRGQPHVWSPAWLQVSEVIAVGEKWTFDASSTPTVGRPAPVRELSPIDLEELAESFRATIERAKRDDPAVLRAQIKELERELAQARKAQPAATSQGPSEAAVRRWVAERERELMKERQAFVRELNQLTLQFQRVLREHQTTGGWLERRTEELAALRDRAGTASPSPRPEPRRTEVHTARVEREVPHRAPARDGAEPEDGEDDDIRLTPGRRRILEALAAFEALGVTDLPWKLVAAFARQSPRSSTTKENLHKLRKGGWITRHAERLALTELGRAVAGPVDGPASLEELHERWDAIVKPKQAAMLREVRAAYPDSVDREELAVATNQSPRSSTYKDNVTTLRGFGVIDYPDARSVSATELLYPPALGG